MNPTPLKDAWNAYKDSLDTSTLFTDLNQLQPDDYVLITKADDRVYTGRVVKVGRKFVTLLMPYGAWADSDFKCMQEIQFPKSEVTRFYKLKK